MSLAFARFVCAAAAAASSSRRLGPIAVVLLAGSVGALPAVAAAAPPIARGEPGVPASAAPVSVWVDLDLPPLASAARGDAAARDALRGQIVLQQDRVMHRLRELGAVEQARVRQVRNALAVRLAPAQIDAARAIPGVRAVRLVRHTPRVPPISER